MRKPHRTAVPTLSRAIGVTALTLGLTALAPVQAGASADRAAAPERATKTVQVGQVNLSFSPTVLKIAVGDTVTWTNHETDQTIHSVVQKNGSELNSPDIAPEQSFTYTFDTAQTYEIMCRFHPDMFMTLEVAGAKTGKAEKGQKLTKAEQKAAKKAADKAAKKAAAKKAAEEAASHDAHAESAMKSTPAPEPGPPDSTIPGLPGLPFSPEPAGQRGPQR